MEVTINDHRKVYAIQKEFIAMFPFLKLEFFAKPHTAGGAASKRHVMGSSKTIGQCRVIHTKGLLTITPHMSVSDVEQLFSDTFGLTVGVFHKSGNNWLESTADMLTLEKQNIKAEEMDTLTKPVIEEKES